VSLSAASTSFDVVVIGGGLAGAVAALTAAQEGRSVALVRAGGGASAHASGAFDVAPDPRRAPPVGATAPTLKELLKGLVAERPHHPYSVLGSGDAATVERMIDAAAKDLFRDLDEEGLLYRGSLSRNMVLPTPGGRWRESAFAQDAIAGADLALLSRARLAVIAIGPGAASRAAAQAAELRRGVEARAFPGLREILPCPVDALPEGTGASPGAGGAPLEPALARALDDPRVAAAWGAEVAKALAAHAPKATHALFPPCLGLAEPAVTVALLARATGREVAETVALPPSTPGLRLERALARALARRGVVLRDARVVEARALRGRVAEVVLEARDGPATLSGGAFVLAGGRFLGGAVRAGNRVVEPLFDLPLWVGARAWDEVPDHERAERRIGQDHAVMSVGVRTAADLRPIGRAGVPAYENLFAAGATLTGSSFAYDRTGLGVALVTGRVAGLGAAVACGDEASGFRLQASGSTTTSGAPG